VRIRFENIRYLKGIGSDKVFELSVVELLEFNFTLACIYRSPIGDFYEFWNKLELVICKVHSKGKRLIICGDWNVNFLQDSVKLQELQNLFLMYDLINTVNSPTRVTNNVSSLNFTLY
jgi:hypothetical protein